MSKQRIKTHARTPEQEALAKKRRNLSQLINKLEQCIMDGYPAHFASDLLFVKNKITQVRKELGTFKTYKT